MPKSRLLLWTSGIIQKNGQKASAKWSQESSNRHNSIWKLDLLRCPQMLAQQFTSYRWLFAREVSPPACHCQLVCGMQVNKCASENGVRYGLIFTHLFLWAVEADGSNNLSISTAIRYNDQGPTALEASLHCTLHAMTCLQLIAALLLDSGATMQPTCL